MNFVASSINLTEEEEDEFIELTTNFDIALSLLLLRSNMAQMAEMSKFPHLLNRMGFECSEASLFFAFGKFEKLRNGMWFESEAKNEEIEEFFESFIKQAIGSEFSNLPDLLSSKKISKLVPTLAPSIYEYRSNPPSTRRNRNMIENNDKRLFFMPIKKFPQQGLNNQGNESPREKRIDCHFSV